MKRENGQIQNFSEEGLELFSNVFQAATEGIIVADAQGQILMANPASERMFGYDSNELEGLDIEKLLPEGLKEKHRQHRKDFNANPKQRPMGQGLDLYGKRKDGNVFPLEISLSYFYYHGEIRFVAFVVDNTHRKQAEEALKASQEQLKEYAQTLESRVKERTHELEHLNLGLQNQIQERKMAEQALRESQKLYTSIARNYPNGTINVLNEDFQYIFVDGKDLQRKKVSRKSLLGTGYLNRFPENKREEVKENLLKALNNQETTFELSFNEEYYRITAVPLNNKSDGDFQILVVEDNITSLKEAEQEIRHALDKERELNELKTRFVSMASHEFRTPLSTILSSVSLIAKYTTSEQQQKREKHIDRIRNSVKHLTDILNDFLSLGKLEEGRIETDYKTFNLKDWMEGLIEEAYGTVKSGQVIDYQHKGPEEVFCDDKLLRNIMFNLISNAIKYSPENCRIEIISTITDQNLEIRVTDQGIGIPENEQKNIFDRFFRAKNVENIQGTGLGLNIVQKYLELIGGQIRFDSEYQKGTTFTINIPQKG